MPAPVYANETDQSLLTRLQELTLEPPNGGASMGTAQFGGPPTSVALANVIAALDQAQRDFMRDAAPVAWHYGYEDPNSITGLSTTPEVERVALPQDMMDVRRRAWISFGPPGTIGGPAFYLLNDSLANTYILTIDDSGSLATAPVAPSSPAPLQLNAQGFIGNSFQIDVDAATQQLETVDIPYNAALPTTIPIRSPGFGFNLIMFQEFANVFVLASTAQAGGVKGVQELPVEDSHTWDSYFSSWETNFQHTPEATNESLAPIPSLYLAPPSSDIGELDTLYIPVATALSNTGVPLSVPPDFAPYIVWRALYLLLNAQTEGADNVRARYCLGRYSEGIMLANSLMAQGNMLQLAGAR